VTGRTWHSRENSGGARAFYSRKDSDDEPPNNGPDGIRGGSSHSGVDLGDDGQGVGWGNTRRESHTRREGKELKWAVGSL